MAPTSFNRQDIAPITQSRAAMARMSFRDIDVPPLPTNLAAMEFARSPSTLTTSKRYGDQHDVGNHGGPLRAAPLRSLGPGISRHPRVITERPARPAPPHQCHRCAQRPSHSPAMNRTGSRRTSPSCRSCCGSGSSPASKHVQDRAADQPDQNGISDDERRTLRRTDCRSP
jgi:hypothetical protein